MSGQQPDAEVERLVRLNVLSPIALTKYAVRSMMAAGGGGRIVLISSVVATTGYSGLSVYGATKAALVGFARSLAREVGALDITVNAVAPGFVDTEMTRGLDDGQRAQIARRSALKRLPEADDVAAASWDSVIFDLPDRDSLQRVPTLEPLRGTREHVEGLLDRCRTAEELVRVLSGG